MRFVKLLAEGDCYLFSIFLRRIYKIPKFILRKMYKIPKFIFSKTYRIPKFDYV